MQLHLLYLGLITVFASTLAGPAARADCTSSVGPRSTQPGAPPKRTIYCGETPQERERAEGNQAARLEACKAAAFGELCAVMAGGHQEAASRHHAAIARSGVPVRAVWGAEDRVIPLSRKARLAEMNPDAYQYVIEGAGHGLTYTHTDRVLTAIME